MDMIIPRAHSILHSDDPGFKLKHLLRVNVFVGHAAPTTTAATTPVHTTATKHHSALRGALVGAAAGHVLGHHALAGAAAGALIQHERNKHR